MKLYPNGDPRQNIALLKFSHVKEPDTIYIAPNNKVADELYLIRWVELRAPSYDPLKNLQAYIVEETLYLYRGFPVDREMDLPQFYIGDWHVEIVGKDLEGGYSVRIWKGVRPENVTPIINETGLVVITPKGWEPLTVSHESPHIGY